MNNKGTVAGLASVSLFFKYLGFGVLRIRMKDLPLLLTNCVILDKVRLLYLIFLICKMLAADYLMSRVDVRIKRGIQEKFQSNWHIVDA